MIRILQVIGGLNRGGAETMIVNLYRAIDHNELQFDFVIHNEKENAYVEEIKQLGGRVFIFPKFKGFNLFSYREYWRHFLSSHPEYHVIHSHIRSYSIVFLQIAKRRGLTTIVHSHSTSNGRGIKGAIKTAMQKPLCKFSDYLFSCSELSGKWLFGDNAISQENYYMVKNAIDVEKYRYDEEKRIEIREKLGINNKVVYGHVGRLSEPKNHMFLIDVFTEIHKRNPNTVLLIVGSGELETQIREKIAVKQLDDSILMLGSRSDVPDIMQAMDVFLFPSLWEGLPVTVVEAQAAGLPCFVSENITKEVDISKAITYLPITNGVDTWVKHALERAKRYPDAINDVINNGFDIKSTSKWITDFYRSIY